MNTNAYVSRVIHPLIYACVQLLCRPMMSYPRNQIVYYVAWHCVLFSITILTCIGCAHGNMNTKNNHTTHVTHTTYMKPWQMKQTWILSNAMFYIRNTVVWTLPLIGFIWEYVHVKTVTLFFLRTICVCIWTRWCTLVCSSCAGPCSCMPIIKLCTMFDGVLCVSILASMISESSCYE